MPVYKLPQDPLFPHPSLAEKDGLLAIGGDLSSERLIQAYALGIFPWFSEGDPIMWWSPDPRMILYPDKLKVSKSLRRLMQNHPMEVRFDSDFKSVVEACAKVPREDQNGTWITQEMQQAYIDLHMQGFAHSVEVYRNNELLGGLYGVSLGKAFFGESMFHLEKDASKVALYHLVERLKKWNFHLVDAQIETAHMIRMGAMNIKRDEFLTQLIKAVKEPTKRGKW